MIFFHFNDSAKSLLSVSGWVLNHGYQTSSQNMRSCYLAHSIKNVLCVSQGILSICRSVEAIIEPHFKDEGLKYRRSCLTLNRTAGTRTETFRKTNPKDLIQHIAVCFKFLLYFRQTTEHPGFLAPSSAHQHLSISENPAKHILYVKI